MLTWVPHALCAQEDEEEGEIDIEAELGVAETDDEDEEEGACLACARRQGAHACGWWVGGGHARSRRGAPRSGTPASSCDAPHPRADDAPSAAPKAAPAPKAVVEQEKQLSKKVGRWWGRHWSGQGRERSLTVCRTGVRGDPLSLHSPRHPAAYRRACP
jgi:hypothetical protein